MNYIEKRESSRTVISHSGPLESEILETGYRLCTGHSAQPTEGDDQSDRLAAEESVKIIYGLK